jgi:hypothetical protein
MTLLPEVSEYLQKPTNAPYQEALHAYLLKLVRREGYLSIACAESPQLGAELREVIAAIKLLKEELRFIEERARVSR